MRAIALTVLCLCTIGCSRSAKLPPPPEGKIAKVDVGGTTAILGECNGKPAVLVWFDHTDCESSPRYEGSHVVFQGFSGIKKGPRGEWWCATTGNGIGEVRIDRKAYKLADGNTFVISTKKGIAVEQMQKDLSSLKADREVLESFKAQELKNLTARDEKKSNP